MGETRQVTRRGFAALVAAVGAFVGVGLSESVQANTSHVLPTDLPTDPKARLCKLVWLWRRQIANEWDISAYPTAFSFAGETNARGPWEGRWPKPDEMRVYQHQMIIGEGTTAIEAIDDWYAKMPRGQWYGVVWRIKPDIESERDFDTKQTRFAVYSRFALIDHA